MRILLVVYDNDSFIHFFPQGTAYIASALREAGHEVELFLQDVYRWPDSYLTEFLDNNPPFDVLGLGVIAGYWQYRKLKSLSASINRSKNRPYYILGGHGPSPDPEYFMRLTGADAVVLGEGEDTIVEFVDALENNRSLSGVKGIAYRDGDGFQTNPRRTLITDIDSISMPAYGMFPIEYYRMIRQAKATNSNLVMPVLSGRGCTFKCNFCYRLDTGYRPRSPEAILEEIAFLQKTYGINYIYFSDELLMASEKRTTELCEAFIKAKPEVDFVWWCNGRLNYAKPELLKLMKKAGCIFANYGVEAADDEVLRNMKKGLRVDQIIPGIEATLEAGISPGINMIWGNLGDNLETLDKAVDMLLRYDDGAQLRTIRPVTPYPGSPLYYHAIEKGLLKDCEDFYENKHLNSDLLAVNFTDLTDDEFHAALLKANTRLIDSYYDKHKGRTIAQAEALYLGQDANFRGFRQL